VYLIKTLRVVPRLLVDRSSRGDQNGLDGGEVMLVLHERQGPGPAGKFAGDGDSSDGVLLRRPWKVCQRMLSRRLPSWPRIRAGAGASCQGFCMVLPGLR
jgi:hypothetical protein